MDLTEQAVIVTGAGSGMGKATACRLARRNALVAALDIAAGPVQALTQELGGNGDSKGCRGAWATAGARQLRRNRRGPTDIWT